ncbi:MAG: trypsin-like peptidase domain-containing protein [Candidatus Anammoximicrobium sp.]|nr:trypsin-like peptidase domain-containing protein [Candidatus Anammoximicrobium sp.]
MMTRSLIRLAAPCWLCAGLVAWSACSSNPLPPPAEHTDEIDFYQASGITQPELAGFLDGLEERENVRDYPMYILLQNDAGDYLADSRVIVRWDTGESRLMVGSSAVIQLLLDKQKLPGLRLIVPRGFTHLTQRTIPLGTAYVPEGTLDTAGLDYRICFDGSISSDLNRGLQRIKALGQSPDDEQVRQQLRRKSTAVALSEPPTEELTPAEIYRRRVDSVVVIGTLFGDGGFTVASGVILNPGGVVATAYHVIDKPPPVVARGVLTRDGTMYPVREILAADKPGDVALLKIDASGLTAAPLSHGDPEGSPVTVISHPASNFFSLTQGWISRYWALTSYGGLSSRMSVTADFADGASGGPIFNSRGAVTGLVSATEAFGDQMVRRSGPPADVIRRLLRPATGEPSGLRSP